MGNIFNINIIGKCWLRAADVLKWQRCNSSPKDQGSSEISGDTLLQSHVHQVNNMKHGDIPSRVGQFLGNKINVEQINVYKDGSRPSENRVLVSFFQYVKLEYGTLTSVRLSAGCGKRCLS